MLDPDFDPHSSPTAGHVTLTAGLATAPNPRSSSCSQDLIRHCIPAKSGLSYGPWGRAHQERPVSDAFTDRSGVF